MYLRLDSWATDLTVGQRIFRPKLFGRELFGFPLNPPVNHFLPSRRSKEKDMVSSRSAPLVSRFTEALKLEMARKARCRLGRGKARKGDRGHGHWQSGHGSVRFGFRKPNLFKYGSVRFLIRISWVPCIIGSEAVKVSQPTLLGGGAGVPFPAHKKGSGSQNLQNLRSEPFLGVRGGGKVFSPILPQKGR